MTRGAEPAFARWGSYNLDQVVTALFRLRKALFETGHNTSTQRQQVNPEHLQEIHLLALRASKFSSFRLDPTCHV